MAYNSSIITTENILNVKPDNFKNIALSIFHYQYHNNSIYHEFCNALHINIDSVKELIQIPFLPISFFKTHQVICGNPINVQMVFESSGTTGTTSSKHFILDTHIYNKNLLQGFQQYYGSSKDYTFLALLPSYLERGNASLVYMAKTLIDTSVQSDNGFYINEWQKLFQVLKKLQQKQQKTILLGVTYALLDFANQYPIPLTNTIVIETGGMKGRAEELTRTEVHEILKKQFNLNQIHSEYGMTELLSQAYSQTDGIFNPTNTMKVLISDINDPLDVSETGTGRLNIIDLANINSCSFIATDDLGKVNQDGTFEVLGRIDNSALRGCSLMAL